MALTGRLGTADSQLGNIELGSVGGATSPTQTIQLRANILGVTQQSLQMRARIRGVATLDMRARIVPLTFSTIDLRANILGVSTASLTMRARITMASVSATLQVTYDVQNRITQRLLIRFNATDKDRNFKTLQMRARILAQVSAGLTISYDVDYAMPSGCAVTRPTQRSVCRVVRTFSARARITR